MQGRLKKTDERMDGETIAADVEILMFKIKKKQKPPAFSQNDDQT